MQLILSLVQVAQAQEEVLNASELGDVEVVRLLLEFRASTDFRDRDRSTALLWASDLGHVEVARLLLNAGAAKDLVDMDPWGEP